METNYGYAITSTPGTISEGSFVLSASGVKAGEIRPCEVQECIATWHSNDAANTAMLGLTPDGVTPAVYAGLSVESAFDVAPREVVNAFVEWMD